MYIYLRRGQKRVNWRKAQLISSNRWVAEYFLKMSGKVGNFRENESTLRGPNEF